MTPRYYFFCVMSNEDMMSSRPQPEYNGRRQWYFSS